MGERLQQTSLVWIIADSDLLRAGLKRVVVEAGLEVADQARDAAILFRVQAPCRAPATVLDEPTDGFDADIVVRGEEVDVRVGHSARGPIETAVRQLLAALHR